MGWLLQADYDMAWAEGYAKGLAERLAEGEAKAFARILEKRFGVIPALIRQRIFSADIECIDAWVKRIFDAPDLPSVFDSK